MIDQIRRMRAEEHSIKKITLALGISRNTVRRYLRNGQVDTSAGTVSAPPAAVADSFDWATALKERGRGRPVKRIYEEMAPPMSYSHFSRGIRARHPTVKAAAIRLHHEPGERTQVDYASGLMITDHRTGKQTPTNFFCGVLPQSSFTFGEFTMSQRIYDFISSHERMWAYFGGVSSYVVLDNLLCGSLHNRLSDTASATDAKCGLPSAKDARPCSEEKPYTVTTGRRLPNSILRANTS